MTEQGKDKLLHGVLFAGGGTGGHIFPGIAIAEALEAGGSVECWFAVSDRPLDAEILRKAERRFEVIPAAPFAARPVKLLRFVSRWGRAVRESRRVIRELKGRCPDGVDVLAMGGFVAAPVVQAAVAEKVPVTLVNLDAAPGLANRWIARRASRVCSAIPTEPGAFANGTRVEVVPPIVRGAALAPGDAGECRRRLGLDPQRPTLLVTGASQGARSINEFLSAFAQRHAELLRAGGWQVIHQTGKGETASVQAAYDKAGVAALVVEFLDDMGVAWGAADLAVTRCGAGNVAEAWANGVPSIMLPYPYHKDQHQKKNAQVLAAARAAALCDDRIDAAANLESVGPVLERLLGDQAERSAMRAAVLGLGPADGARQVAGLVRVRWGADSRA